ncbi:MAG: hypothetical protein M1839_007447 [Geoglossum umbratile]|nr:MAG: hypothetical protein M1839_007447 [Geoglossum umbratile]
MSSKKTPIRPPTLFDVFFPIPKLKPKRKATVAATAAATAAPVAPLATPPPAAAVPLADSPAPEPAASPPVSEPLPAGPAAWTDVEDEELMGFKEAGKAWKEIGSAMERPLHDIKRRYGELRRTRAEAEKPATKQGKRNEKPVTKPVTKQKERDEGSASANMTIPFLREVENWSTSELILLLEIAKRYEQTKWLYIASGFYDKTGRRVTAEEVREKLGG